MGEGLIKALLEQATAKGSRSTILKPLGWMMAMCISATITSASIKLEAWIIYIFAIFAGITMLLYLIAYVYCLFKDRDALRSETYSIQKLAIEKGFIGDDITGVIEIDKDTSDDQLKLDISSFEEVDK